MSTDAPLAILILVATTLPLTWLALRGASSGRRLAGIALWFAAAAALGAAILAWPHADPVPPADRPIESAHGGYVTSRACQGCHPGEYATWHRSYHRTMTQAASTRTLLGPVDGVVVRARGRPYALERRGEEVWVEMDDPAWTGKPEEAPRVERQIVQTTGSHTEQFYWIASGKGRNLTILPILYRGLAEQHWASLDGCCISEPGFVQDLADGRWNRVCNRCHATHTLPGIVEGTDATDTRVAELGIACEACHGPGGEHAEHYKSPLARYAQHGAATPAAAIVNPRRLSKERSSEVCGQCHGVTVFRDDAARKEWREHGFPYRPGDELEATRELARSGTDRFWNDGMMRVSGREYNGLVRSPCYLRGEMQCLSCHSLHHADPDETRSLDVWADDLLHPGMDGDRACTQCHAKYATAEAQRAHTHHGAGSSGSSCLNCHMPYTVYGLLKSIRSHQVSSPSVQESVEVGRPNACNLCHLDKPLAWTAESLERWYSIAPPQLDGEQRRVSAAVLWMLRGDAGQRVLAACSLGWKPAREVAGTDWMVPYLLILLQDPYRAVRVIAHRTLLLHPEARAVAEADPLVEPAELAHFTQPVLDAWSAAGRRNVPGLLIDARGRIDLQAVQQLLSRRDERPVVLNE